MKANEAPEKIYLTTFGFPICEPIPQDSSNPDTVWIEKPYMGADSIEYTRTDAFIEKACGWLEENKDKYLYNKGEKDEYIPTCTGKMIEDFRKYMEREKV